LPAGAFGNTGGDHPNIFAETNGGADIAVGDKAALTDASAAPA